MSETTVAPAAPGSETTEATQRDLEYHGKAHGATGRDKVLHPLLGGLHTGSGSGSGGASDLPVLGDLIVAQGSPAAWQRYGLVVPAGAALRNALVTDLGDTVPTHKPTLDATNPTTIAEAAAAAPGTSLIYSHRDHTHGAPATWKATAHNLLDGDRHGDTVVQTVSRGSLVKGNATPKWDELVIGAAGTVLKSDGSDAAWGILSTYSTYTPVVTQSGTVTSFTVTSARYSQFGKTVHCHVYLIVNNAGGAVVGNAVRITLPVAAANLGGIEPYGTGYIYDASANLFYQGLAVAYTGGTTEVAFLSTASHVANYLGATDFTAILQTSDQISFNITYEVA